MYVHVIRNISLNFLQIWTDLVGKVHALHEIKKFMHLNKKYNKDFDCILFNFNPPTYLYVFIKVFHDKRSLK